jgi:hypothetical protein
MSHYNAAAGGTTKMASDYALLYNDSGIRGINWIKRSQLEMITLQDWTDLDNGTKTLSSTPWGEVPFVYCPFRTQRIRVIVRRNTGAEDFGTSHNLYLYLRVRSPHIRPGMRGAVGRCDVSTLGEHWSAQGAGGVVVTRMRHALNEAQISVNLRNYSYWAASADRNHSNGNASFTSGKYIYLDLSFF